jgi:serine/threonine protein kinase
LRAIKRPQTRDGLERDILLARFRREVQAVGAIKHDHVVRALDAGADDDGPYLITEYLDGRPLSRLGVRQRPLPVALACELIRQAALGLQAAHECGLVHRDVKPSNLMLARVNTDMARVVVIDWGLVKRAGEGVPAGSAADALTRHTGMGTVDYMAPEQIGNASTVDIRADIYSLGATFYYLLAGAAPFHGRRDTEKLVAHETQPFPPLPRNDVPPQVLAILGRMVEKNPAQRYATPGEVAQALAPHCGTDPRLLVNLLSLPTMEPVAPETPAHFATSPFGQPTVLATGPAPTWPAQGSTTALSTAGTWKRWAVVLGGGGAMLALLVFALVMIWPERGDKGTDGKKGGKSGTEQVLIDEKFDKQAGLPPGWTGDAFRVVTHQGRHCLEVSSAAGDYLVKLPPVALPGDFSIEGAYLITVNPFSALSQKLTLLLESSKANAPLPVVIYGSGDVWFGDDKRNALPTYKANQPTTFTFSRKGNTLSVALNGEPVATKDLKAVVPYDTLSLGMPASASIYSTRLFNLKVTAAP